MTGNQSNAIVVSLNSDVSEIIELANSLDYNVIETFFQHLEKPDVKSYVGSGKVDEIKEFIKDAEKDIVLVIVNGELKPSQWFSLEKKLNVEVYDRVRLILAIFAERADRKEARLQVKLAQLQYERPFVRELIHRARSGEHPGLMAGGEYQVDDYYEMIKKQVKKIKEELEGMRNSREIRRRHRHIGGFYLVSLAGYTNAGKSSLLNLLSDEKVKVEGKLFSTLSTTTRRIKNKNIPVLITDTVGFIKNLPALIIDAFHSTLEEIEVADVVLLIADVSEEKELVANKLKISLDELVEINVNSSIIVVLNKTDLISTDELFSRIEYLKNRRLLEDKEVVTISSKNRENVNDLLSVIYNSLPQLVSFKIKLPVNEDTQSFISWIYERAFVSDIFYDEFVTLSIVCNPKMHEKIVSKCKNLKGFVVNRLVF